MTLPQIRRYKASSEVMEKASQVYNKLKMQFLGKTEGALKSQPENKDPANSARETKNGKVGGFFAWSPPRPA